MLEYQTGTWAEQTVALEHEVCLINDENMSYVEAAAASMGAFVNGDMIKGLKVSYLLLVVDVWLLVLLVLWAH